MFTAVNSNPTSSSSSASATAAGVSQVGSANTTIPTVTGGSVNVAQQKSQGGLTGTRLAIAILMPILIAMAAVGAYVFFVRRREAFKRTAWVETIDKRMSRLSGDWQSMSAVGGGASRPSMQSSRARTPKASAHSRPMSMLGGARPSVSAEPVPTKTTSVYDQHASGPFAAEDLSQLGPRARALSEAAAAGRPISTTISTYSQNDLPVPPLPTGRSRSKSIAGMDGADARPSFLHSRTLSTASNNPYAPAMAQRSSQALSVDGAAIPFPPSSTSPIPRSRLDSNGRSVDPASRNRVTSRVSFAEVTRPSGDRRRNQSDAEKQVLRASARNQSTADEFTIDFGDAYPALACTSLLYFLS